MPDQIVQPPSQNNVPTPGDKTTASGQTSGGGVSDNPPSNDDKTLLGGSGNQVPPNELLGDKIPATTPVEDKKVEPPPVEGVQPLPANATEEQKKQFKDKMRALMGVPENAEAYGDFGFGEAVKIDTQSEVYKGYTGKFHELGFTKEQAKGLLEYHKTMLETEGKNAQRQADEKNLLYRKEAKEKLVRECGSIEKFTELQSFAEKGFKAAAKGAELTEADYNRMLAIMGDDTRFIKIFGHIGKNFREDVLVTGSAPGAKEDSWGDTFNKLFPNSSM